MSMNWQAGTRETLAANQREPAYRLGPGVVLGTNIGYCALLPSDAAHLLAILAKADALLPPDRKLGLTLVHLVEANEGRGPLILEPSDVVDVMSALTLLDAMAFVGCSREAEAAFNATLAAHNPPTDERVALVTAWKFVSSHLISFLAAAVRNGHHVLVRQGTVPTLPRYPGSVLS